MITNVAVAPEFIHWNGYAVLYDSSPMYARSRCLALLDPAGLSLINPHSPASKLQTCLATGEMPPRFESGLAASLTCSRRS